MKNGTYFLLRVEKHRGINNQFIINKILKPASINTRNFNWTFTDTTQGKIKDIEYYYAKLTKYTAEGAVKLVDTKDHAQREAIAPNLLIASSPFVFIPAFSAISFLRVWNQIETETFSKRFQTLIKHGIEDPFAECELQIIADLVNFKKYLTELVVINEIKATVKPPNPLFGKIWEELHHHMQKRNSTEMKVSETSTADEGLRTNLQELISQTENDKEISLDTPADIADAAFLMAADGYGKAKLVGSTKTEKKVITPNDAPLTFTFKNDPAPKALAEITIQTMQELIKKRRMTHDE